MTVKQRALAENVATFTCVEFVDGIKWHRTIDTFCCSCKPEGPEQDGEGMGCQKPHEIHQEQMPVLAVGVRWSGATLPGESLAGRALRGCCLIAGWAWASSVAWKQKGHEQPGLDEHGQECRGRIILLSSLVIRLSVLRPSTQ